MHFLWRRLLNRLRHVSLEAAAVRSTVVAPAIDLDAKPSLYLDEDIDAIESVISSSTLEEERRRILGESRTHLATIQYELHDVRMRDVYIASRGHLAKMPTNRPVPRQVAVDHHTHAILSTNILSGLEFGHWIRDSLVTEMRGAELDTPALGLAREAWQHEPGYREIAQLECIYTGNAHVDRLLILDDRGCNDYWASRFLALRRRMQTRLVPDTDPSLGALVFVDRGGAARMRDPTNLPEVRAALETLGFRTLIPTEQPVAAIRAALRDARIVISVEGSNLNHVHMLAPEGITLITLQDPRRFYAYHKRMIDIYGDRFGFVVGRPSPDSPGRYRINVDQLQRLIDLVRPLAA